MNELSDILQLMPTVICWVIVGVAITGVLIVVFKKKEVENIANGRKVNSEV